jgi:hypothetical protein
MVWAMARVTAAEIGPVVLDGGVVCHVDGPSVTVCARNATVGGLEISGPCRRAGGTAVNRRLPSWCDTCRKLVPDPLDCCPDCGGGPIRFRRTHVAVDPASGSTRRSAEEP